MADIHYYRPQPGKVYLDELQDEAFFRSSLHGDALLEAESRIPVRSVAAMPPQADLSESHAEVMSLSGSWRMLDSEPADPGEPAPSTGWFGRASTASRGMEERWYESGVDRSSWHKVTVPTTVQRALVSSGLLPDPNWNTNMIDELEEHGEPKDFPLWFRRTRVEQREWWFAKTFNLPEEWRGRQLTLRFDGIDYSGTVFVNGMSLGHHKGMFGGPELDISGLAQFGKPNELVVRIDPAPQTWNGLLKGSPGFGWHYGHLISMGIWRDVTVRAEPEIAIRDPYVATMWISPDEARLCIEYTVDSRLEQRADIAIEGVLQLGKGTEGEGSRQDAKHRFRNHVEIAYGKQRFRTEVTLPAPCLWWPAGYGEQPLYCLTLTAGLQEKEQQGPVQGKVRIAGASTVFGVRTIEMEPAKDAKPHEHYRWQFLVNGVPLFIKGANWCWPDPMLEQSEETYERLLELARRGHVQMLRAWGGGLVEGDYFYRLCDEKGIMVYQEFPLCWGPPDSPYTDLGVIDRQVTQSVKALRNHPSLVMWGGGNENGVHGGADEGLFLVGRRCRQLDPSRPFHRTDPWGGSVHNWNVYHGGEPLDVATLAMPSVFYGEFGIPSMTSRSSCIRFMPEEELEAFPPTEDSRGWMAHLHQFGLKDVIKVMRYAAYGPMTTWDAYIAYSQTAQGDSIRFTADVQRAGAGHGKTGFCYYKLTDLFPGHSWGVVDFYGAPKLSYYRAKQACRPQNAFLVYGKIDGWLPGESLTADLYAISDTLTGLKGARISFVLYDSSLDVMLSRSYDNVSLQAGFAYQVDRIQYALPSAESIQPLIAAVTLHEENGTLLSDQWYWFNARSKPAELLEFEQRHTHRDNEYPGELAVKAFELYAGLTDAPLKSLPETSLEWSIERKGRLGRFRIRNSGERPAIRVIIEHFPEEGDCYLDDNDFGLFPGEERVVLFEADPDRSLQDIIVGAWNAQGAQAAITCE